jgi:hypothetical protein
VRRRYGIAMGVVVVAAAGVLGGRELAVVRTASDAPGHAFTIGGSAGGLVPGKRVPLRLTVTNAEAQPMLVTSVVATAQQAARSCPASLLDITAYTGNPQTVVAARGQAVIELSVTLSAAAPDSCRRAAFPLTYGGKAEQWH